jgi:hypothetical protein
LYLYAMNVNRQVAWVAKLQLIIYTMCNLLQLNYNFITTLSKQLIQLLCNSIITTPMMSC